MTSGDHVSYFRETFIALKRKVHIIAPGLKCFCKEDSKSSKKSFTGRYRFMKNTVHRLKTLMKTISTIVACV